jgi:hypothetical protein
LGISGLSSSKLQDDFYKKERIYACRRMNLPAIARENSLFNNRFLGTLAMLGAPMLLVETVLRMAGILPQKTDNAWIGVLEMFYIGGWIALIGGMRRLRATGDGARILLIVQMFVLIMAFLFGAQVFFGAISEKSNQTLLFKITDLFFRSTIC